jgi:hypothetical protein
MDPLVALVGGYGSAQTAPNRFQMTAGDFLLV